MTTEIDAEAQQKEAIRNTFNTVANAYGTGACRFFHTSGQTMSDLHDLTGHEHVLDLACGTGASAIPIAKKLSSGKVTGLDFSDAMLEQARTYAQRENIDNVYFSTGDMTQIPYEDATFDHANCAFGLFFVEDMASLLDHISNKVKPGGKVMISGFCGDSFMPAAALTLDALRNHGLEVPDTPGWKRMAEPEQLAELFDAAGLKNMTIERKSLGYYITPEEWWEILWNAGFRGLIAQLGDKLEDFKQANIQAVSELADDNGLWLEIDVNYTWGEKA